MENLANGTHSLFDRIEPIEEAVNIWKKGINEIAESITSKSKAQFTDSLETWKSLTQAKTFEEASRIQRKFVQSYLNGIVSGTSEMTEAFTNLTEKSAAPLKAHVASFFPKKV